MIFRRPSGSPAATNSAIFSVVRLSWLLKGSIHPLTCSREALTFVILPLTALVISDLIWLESPMRHKGLKSIWSATASKDSFASPLQNESRASTVSRIMPADLRALMSVWKYSSRSSCSWIPRSRTGSRTEKLKRRCIFSAMVATAALSSSTTLSAFFAASNFCSTLTSAASVSPTCVFNDTSFSTAAFKAFLASSTSAPACSSTCRASCMAFSSPSMAASRSSSS
mmetsp:Transcript_8965/g.20338  ORF Transcript_8965/g.20338 Transcript_8965/m.20338 type:complete len:226 (+) Transcript_8965:46-723(+)